MFLNMMNAAKDNTDMQNQPQDNELFLIDGSGFIFRAYYAMAYSHKSGMTNPDGVEVGAVFGYTNMLLKMLRDYHAPYLAVIFDAKRENFRNEIYPAYKANRDETPDDLKPQFAMIREATEAFDIPAIELEGFEADDLIAAYAKLAKAQGKKIVIVSSDKDLMQLVDDDVRMLDPMKQKWIGQAEVIEKFGVPPHKVVEVQALAGDASDNVPGVPGIGVKIAAQLINEYGSLEELLARAGEIKQNKRRENLIEHADMARISERLVRLDEDAPVPVALEDLKTHDPDKPALMAFLEKQGFKSIMTRLGGNSTDVILSDSEGPDHISDPSSHAPQDDNEDWPKIKNNQYTLINTEQQLQEWIAEAYKNGTLCIDTETTGLTPAKVDLVGISLSSEIGKAAYIPLGHIKEPADLFSSPSPRPSPREARPGVVFASKDSQTEFAGGEGRGEGEIEQLDIQIALKLLKPILEDPSVMKIAHNMKYDWQMFAKHGIHITPCDDTMLISYVLDGSSHSHSMDNLSAMHLNHQPTKYEDVAGKGVKQVSFDKVSIEAALDYAAEDADITLRLYKALKPRLAQEKMTSVYENIERPLIPVIAAMELEGIKVDPAVLKEMSAEFGKRIADLEGAIQDIAGTQFNVGSPKQIGEILFDQMGLEGGKKTKTGQWATDVKTLEKLAADGEIIVQKILDWRGLSKLKSTYTDALQDQINPATGRVHTSYHMSGTSTGRLASSDPNLQNIPIRTEDGRRIRRAFVAQEGHTLLSVDYSQVELRLCAEMAGVEALKQAFADGVDVHSLTASRVFNVPLDEVSPELRRQAKAVNFGIIYGISGWGLAKQLGCAPAEANEFIKRYLTTFNEIQDYMEARKEEARGAGFVKTLYGRKCFTPNINAKMPMMRQGAERAAINAPLQGTAADIMKIAMGKMPGALADEGLSAKMLLQVHDELIFEVPNAELEKTTTLARAVMENAYKIMNANISVPLNAEAGSGRSWAEAH